MNANKIRVLMVVLALSAFWQVNLFAQDTPRPLSTTVDRQAMTAARAYWTPERLQSAIPMDLLSGDVNNLPPQPTAVPTDPGSEGFTPAQGPRDAAGARFATPQTGFGADPATVFQQFYAYPEPFTRYDVPISLYDESQLFVQYPHSTIGKLFFTKPTVGNFVCSASVVRPHLLLTARHCVFDNVHGFYANEVFFPAYHAGANVILSPQGLGGGWPARILATWTAPCCGLDALDIGFIQTLDDDGVGCGGSAGGLPIEAYTSFLGTMWAGNFGNEPVRHYDEMGYPQAFPFSGNWMVQSESSTADFDLFNLNDTIEVGNDETGGSSGGPWVVGWDPGANPGNPPGGGNFANGLNSFKWTTPARPLEMGGPQFKDYNFNQLRLFAEGLACP